MDDTKAKVKPLSSRSLDLSLCRQSLLAIVAAIFFVAGAFAQSFTASVRGNVTDQTGASIGAAVVSVTDVDRGTVSTATADESGRYVVTALPPGNYTLAVEAPGFKRFMKSIATRR